MIHHTVNKWQARGLYLSLDSFTYYLTLHSSYPSMSSTNVTIHDILATVGATIETALHHTVPYVEAVPGGPIVVRYIRSSHRDDPVRTILELALLVFAIRYFTTSRSSVKKKDFVKLSEREIDDLVDDWEPEPLVVAVDEKEQWKLDALRTVEGAVASHIKLEGDESTLINAASLNFLDLGLDKQMITNSKETIRNTGVGACGPPNFYGNQDIHVKLENDLAKFFGAEGAVLYGQDFTTAGSVLPSFLKRGDYIVCDSSCNLAIQKALSLTRSNVFWFKHNDYEDLEKILKDLKKEYFKNEKPISRKFIITEGLFATVGDSPDLSKLVELKEKYKFRLFIDETLSAGVLGKTGRGLAEMYNIPRSKIDITICSMANAFCSSGAFCVGDSVMTYHQRIGSLAYCFSASLPPYTARATSTALDIIDQQIDPKTGESKIVKTLRSKSALLHKLFTSDKTLAKLVKITSTPESAILHMFIAPELREKLGLPLAYTGSGSEMELRNRKGVSDKLIDSLNNEEYLLQEIIYGAQEHGVVIARSTYTWSQEIAPLIPGLKISVNAGLTDKDVEKVHKVVSKEVVKSLKGLTAKKLESIVAI